MTPAEAIEAMEALGHDFFVFRDRDSNTVQVRARGADTHTGGSVGSSFSAAGTPTRAPVACADTRALVLSLLWLLLLRCCCRRCCTSARAQVTASSSPSERGWAEQQQQQLWTTRCCVRAAAVLFGGEVCGSLSVLAGGVLLGWWVLESDGCAGLWCLEACVGGCRLSAALAGV